MFVNKKHKQITLENGSDLCVGSILAPGSETQLKLKLKCRIHMLICPVKDLLFWVEYPHVSYRVS